jgi:haloalkane dehalogenase
MNTWPFPTLELKTRAGDLAVTDNGSGPPLLLVHVGTWSFLWRDLATLLEPNFRCIFFDAPGSGRSGDPPEGRVTLEGAARAVECVIEALDLRDFTLVVHDLGGPAGLAAVADNPWRVRNIVALNAFGWRPAGAALRGMLALMGSAPIRALDVATGFLPRIASTAFGVGRHMDEASRRAYRDGMGPRERRSFHDYLRDARRCDGLYQRAERALVGPLAGLPMLTIFGERNDPFGFQKRWKELFPQATQGVVAKGNHFPMCDAPEQVARSLARFAGEHTRSAGEIFSGQAEGPAPPQRATPRTGFPDRGSPSGRAGA